MRIRSLLLAGVALFALTNSTFAADTGWYVGLGAGYSMPQAVKFPTITGVTANGQTYLADEAQFKNTWRGIGTFGYAWSNHFRFEAEGGYTDPNLASLKLNGLRTAVGNADVRQSRRWETCSMTCRSASTCISPLVAAAAGTGQTLTWLAPRTDQPG